MGVYAGGRASWRFPQFEVTCPFEPGMSGGPVIHADQICGVVSYGPELEGGKRGPSFAAALWPLLVAHSDSSVDPRLGNNPLLEMIANGAIDAPAWKQIRSRISVTISDDGEAKAELES